MKIDKSNVQYSETSVRKMSTKGEKRHFRVHCLMSPRRRHSMRTKYIVHKLMKVGKMVVDTRAEKFPVVKNASFSQTTGSFLDA